jgi:hypothetical protein
MYPASFGDARAFRRQLASDRPCVESAAMSLRKTFAGVVLVGLLSGCTGPHSPRAVETGVSTDLVAALRADLGYLASDDLEGRGVGTEGLRAAGDFIANRFQTLGLKPLPGFDGYFHNFDMTIGSRVGENSRLAAGDRALKLESDWRPLGWSPSAPVAGEVVFVGYAINAPQQEYNDFADVDVKGKIVVAMRYEPHDAEGNSRWGGASNTRNATLFTKARVAQEAGAAALILVNPPTHRGPVSDQLLPFSGGGARSQIPVLTITRAVLDEWLSNAGKPSIAELQKEIDEQVKPNSFLIDGVSLTGEVQIEPRREVVRNVIGVLPGKGPLASEYVVIGAHYDHLGFGGQGSLLPGSTDIHNGADDNASGTSALLHVAERVARAGPQERSIIFMAFTAEETGLIGSARFVEDERAPVDRIIAMINLDMVGRIRNDMLYVGGGGTAAPFEAMLEEIDADSPLQMKSMGRGGRGPSDHASFSRKKIPVLFLFSGLHEDYHRPTDTADKINYDGIAEVVSVASKLVARIAAMPREQYVDKYDAEGTNVNIGQDPSARRGRRATTQPTTDATTQPSTAPSAGVSDDQAPSPRRVRLGVMPDMTSGDSVDGVRITGTSPNTPAARAGLQDGDVITRIGDYPIQNLFDLQEALARIDAGKSIILKVKRDGKEIEVPVTLTATEAGQ